MHFISIIRYLSGKLISLICIFIAAFSPSVAQNIYNVDSLYNLKQETKQKEVEIKTTIDLANVFLKSDLQRAAMFAMEAKKMVEEYEGDSSNTWAKRTEAEILNVLAFIEANKGNIKHAIEIFDQSIRIKKDIKDKAGVATSINNIGYLFLQQQNPEKAFGYFKYALDSLKSINDKRGMGVTLGNMGLAMFYIEGVDSSLQYYFQAKEYLEETKSYEYLASMYNSIGSLLNRKGDHESAEMYYKKSIHASSQTNDKVSLARTYGKLAHLSIDQGKTKQAILYGEEGLQIAKQFGAIEPIAELTKTLHSVYSASGNYKEALKYFKQHVNARDSIANVENATGLLEKELTHRFDRERMKDSIASAKEREVTQLQYEQKVVRQKTYTYTGAVGLLIALLFSLYIYKAYKQKNKLNLSLSEKNQEIIDSINYAKRLQEAILPPQKLVKECLQESFILYKPKDIVAGDFYWMEIVNDTVYFAAADCTGHGVPGAMVSVICSSALSKSLIEENITDVGKLLDRTRDLVVERFGRSEENIQDGMDLALCALNTKTNELNYAGANNPLWIIRKGASEVEETKADKQPIGKYDAEKPFTTHTIELKEGDTIYVFSDGYPDQFGGEKGKKYKTGAMKKFLLYIQNENMATQHKLLNEEFESWKGELEQIDDVCVIGVRI